MQLLGPALSGVKAREKRHHKAGELSLFLFTDAFPCVRLAKITAAASSEHGAATARLKTVVGAAAAKKVEIMVSLTKGIEKARPVADIDVRRARKFLTPGCKFWLADSQSFVGTERRKDSGRQVARGDSSMIAGHRWDRRLRRLEISSEFHEPSDPCRGRHWRAPTFSEWVLVQQNGDSKIALQFEMAPGVERISQPVGESL